MNKYASKDIIPEIGKTYACFDDGKIRHSRKYMVTIDKIVPFEEGDKDTLALWREEINRYYWLFAKETDFFVLADGQWYARTIDDGWFAMGDYLSDTGLMDVTGSLEKDSPYMNGEF